MLKPRTHFEQIPLEAVRKIVEEQAVREMTTRLDQATGKKKSRKALLAPQEESTASSRMSFHVELSK
jgi:hypothetical protein